MSAVFAGFSLALAGRHRLPVPPGLPGGRHDGKVVVWGAMFFVVLAGYAFALQPLGGLPVDPAGRGAALALAASVGTLPGVFLRLRMRRAYSHLPRSLLELSPSVSVAHRLDRARWEAWAPFPRTAIMGPRPDESLREAYRAAHREAFARLQTRLMVSDGLAPAPRPTSWDGSGWVAAGGVPDPHSDTFDRIPPHLDGIDDAARAAAVDCANATSAAACFAELAFHVDRLYPFGVIVVAVWPATTVTLDAEGRPHAEDGPALAWADGTHIHGWHGRLVLPEIVDRDLPVTPSRINRQLDPDRRWVLIERYGLGRYLLEAGAPEIHRDSSGRLYRLPQRWGEPILAVRVVNHTPEPDGSLREFWLRVPPTMATARQAVAWTFGLSAEEYEPVAQS